MTVGETGRDVILVLGMHRSGTSAFAGTLACLGLALPARLMAADTANASGYFESWELASLHNAMLRTAKSRWDDWSPIADDWFAERTARGFAGRIVEFLDREFAGAANFVIKDPRICRVVPVWRDALARFGANPHVVLPLRHPVAVAQSLMARDGFLPAESYLLWLRHILDAERATRDLPRVFVSFDDLVGDWRGTVDAIAARFGISWPRSMSEAAPNIERFLDPRLRHHLPLEGRAGVADRTTLFTLEAWELLGELARRKAAPDLFPRLDALRERLDRIPSNYRLPLGIGPFAGRIVHLISRLRVKRNVAGAERSAMLSTKVHR